MKHCALRFFIAIFSFTVGVSAATLVHLRPDFPSALSKPVLPREAKRSDANLSAWQVLLSFENQDLRKLDHNTRVELQKAVAALVGKEESGPFIPRLVSKISNAQGQMNYALIEESPLLTIPGGSGIRVHTFSLEGKLRGSSAFPSGWRIILTGMNVIYVPEIGREALVVSSQPVINGRDVAKQYYALVGDKVLLIRLEDSGGKLLRNTYGAPNHTIGLTLAGCSASEWEKAFESDDLAEVLATLTWLGGAHLNPRKPSPEYAHEEMNEARIADEVRSRERVKVTLRKLMQSGNVWVRKAAGLAEKGEHYTSGIRLG